MEVDRKQELLDRLESHLERNAAGKVSGDFVCGWLTEAMPFLRAVLAAQEPEGVSEELIRKAEAAGSTAGQLRERQTPAPESVRRALDVALEDFADDLPQQQPATSENDDAEPS
jgi:hypothetical protein